MGLEGARTLIAGATGELGGRLARALSAQGARVVLAGRDRARRDGGGTIVALSAIVADYPTAGMAAYSASKAALSAYLAAVRREDRRDGLNVIDVRPQHMDTGFSERALAGTPPPLPEPVDAGEVVERILDAVRRDRRELHWDLKSKRLVTA